MSNELINSIVLTPSATSATPSSSILFFPSVLCQIFEVCVRNPPPILIADGMQNVTAMRGDTVEFRCRVQDVFRQHEKYILKARVNNDEWILRIRDVDVNFLFIYLFLLKESDIGGYICQLNSNPILTKSAYLNLKIPPTVSRSSTPSAVEVREGHNVTLTCHAEGNPKPTVIWRRQDRQIIRYNGANGYGESVYKGSELRLNRVSRKHMSEYVCVASNGIPPDESWTINVSERYKSLHVLEIKEVSIGEFGRYRCVATNDYGKHFADIQLIEAPISSSNSISLLTEGSGDLDDDTEIGEETSNMEYPHLLIYDTKDKEKSVGMDYRRRAADSYLRDDNYNRACCLHGIEFRQDPETEETNTDIINNSSSHASHISHYLTLGTLYSYLQYPLMLSIWTIFVLLNPVF